ncbi:DUF2235 domain-containing protein [Schlegelella aquatica]|uniref:DUF2235 domain-containing protein n=1 Tax=Caldimonas aquatica TaxID=376175 RepID=A0ABY6MSW0_9BURK|nr:DUF2235 domain-containing protein [Schlegelella aquatica]UZD55071.1 DUF2235 domain-containing protein [Schlegelella aquatica]
MDKVRTWEMRELPAIGQPGRSCETNLFFGFFFDGTRNHYGLSEERGDHTHSNVARLFDAYPGQTIAPQAMLDERVRWPNEAAYPNYFRIYMPGVGTPFEEIDDSGRGLDEKLGSAFARWGERRIVWALAQAINAVHRYFHKAPLLSNAEVLALARQVDLNRHALRRSPRFVMHEADGFQAANTQARLQQGSSACTRRLGLTCRTRTPGSRNGWTRASCATCTSVPSAFRAGRRRHGSSPTGSSRCASSMRGCSGAAVARWGAFRSSSTSWACSTPSPRWAWPPAR